MGNVLGRCFILNGLSFWNWTFACNYLNCFFNLRNLPPDKDLELADAVAGKIESSFGYDRIMSWDKSVLLEYRVVEFAFSVVGHAECNGYVAFLMMDCCHKALPVCFRELGMPDLAAIVDSMLAPILSEGILGNVDALERHFGGWEGLTEWVSRYESDLFANFSRIVSAISDYCRKHASCFGQLGDDIRWLLEQ